MRGSVCVTGDESDGHGRDERGPADWEEWDRWWWVNPGVAVCRLPAQVFVVAVV